MLTINFFFFYLWRKSIQTNNEIYSQWNVNPALSVCILTWDFFKTQFISTKEHSLHTHHWQTVTFTFEKETHLHSTSTHLLMVFINLSYMIGRIILLRCTRVCLSVISVYRKLLVRTKNSLTCNLTVTKTCMWRALGFAVTVMILKWFFLTKAWPNNN